jgi:hypothetical protein
MALAILADVSKRVIVAVNANPGTFSATVATNPVIGAFPTDADIQDAVFQGEANLITKGYFNSINNTLCQPFLAFTAATARGANVAFHYGNMGRAEVSKSVSTFLAAAINTTLNQITITTHGLVDGTAVSWLCSGTFPTLTTGIITALMTFYVRVLDANTIALTLNYNDAINGTNTVDFTVAGSGTMTLIAWQTGTEAESVDDVTSAVAVGTYVQADAFNFLYKVDSGTFYHPAPYGRIELPGYTRTATLQANQADEILIAALAIKYLTRNASPANFEAFYRIADEGMMAILRDGSYNPPGDANP